VQIRCLADHDSALGLDADGHHDDGHHDDGHGDGAGQDQWEETTS
jgi:hypothetical protein